MPHWIKPLIDWFRHWGILIKTIPHDTCLKKTHERKVEKYFEVGEIRVLWQIAEIWCMFPLSIIVGMDVETCLGRILDSLIQACEHALVLWYRGISFRRKICNSSTIIINGKALEYIEKHDYKSVIESHNSSNRNPLI